MQSNHTFKNILKNCFIAAAIIETILFCAALIPGIFGMTSHNSAWAYIFSVSQGMGAMVAAQIPGFWEIAYRKIWVEIILYIFIFFVQVVGIWVVLVLLRFFIKFLAEIIQRCFWVIIKQMQDKV